MCVCHQWNSTCSVHLFAFVLTNNVWCYVYLFLWGITLTVVRVVVWMPWSTVDFSFNDAYAARHESACVVVLLFVCMLVYAV